MSSEDMYDELQTLISKFNTRYHFRYVLLWNESNDDISLRVFVKKPEWHNIFLHKGNKFNSVREMNGVHYRYDFVYNFLSNQLIIMKDNTIVKSKFQSM
jgi:hypothetical protein